jgi:hypothetical protein
MSELQKIQVKITDFNRQIGQSIMSLGSKSANVIHAKGAKSSNPHDEFHKLHEQYLIERQSRNSLDESRVSNPSSSP